jgi:hypothetical protein
MFSKLLCNLAVKNSSVTYAKNAGMRFAQAASFNNRAIQMIDFQQRTYIKQLGLDASALAEWTPEELKKGEVSLWQEQSKREETALVLKSKDEIERYVLSIVRNYFRTTKKAKVALESSFEEHGLDSLDVIELVI